MISKSLWLSVGLSVSLASLAAVNSFGQGTVPGAAVPVPPQAKPLKSIKIDLDRSVTVPLPKAPPTLKATIFKTPDDKEGWEINIPGGRPIATPYYWNGMIFVGGGYGSYEFYAFDAESGKLLWQYKTHDDGPTAAVVEDGYCAFNTESCTVYVLDAKTGKKAWEEWLGDPLMSQPTIYKGKLYMAFPGGQRGQTQNVAQNSVHNTAQHTQAAVNAQAHTNTTPGHKLLCADLKTGKHYWVHDITADVISAPIAADGKIFLTCQDGTSFCLDAESGKEVWKKEGQGTAAPVVSKGSILQTAKVRRGSADFEGIQIASALIPPPPAIAAAPMRAEAPAPYFQGVVNGSVGLKAVHDLDSSVGFGGGMPNSEKAKKNLNISSVAAGWAYQGARAAVKDDTAFQAQASAINSVSTRNDGHYNWRAEATGKKVQAAAQIFSPPALGKENLYLVSQMGDILSLKQNTGEVSFAYSTNRSVAFQPAMANGNIYVGTSDGALICLKTGNKDADGWSGWGGNAQHNK